MVADLLCPKDQTPMHSLERSGVTLERCPECGGIFLDRGELERLEEAEAPGFQPQPAQASPSTSGRAVIEELLTLARQYLGGRRRY